METTQAPEVIDFDYLNLNDVDPEAGSNTLPTGVYNLKIASAELADHVCGPNSAKAGQTIKKVTFKFVVLDEQYAGRTVYARMYQSDRMPVFLRKIQDATGVRQEGDIYGWFAELNNINPDLRAKLESKQSGIDVNWFTVQVSTLS